MSDPSAGDALHAFAAELFPLRRSLTGDGVRETLRRIAERIPLEMREVPTGTQVLDWTVPAEWDLREAYIADSSGRRVVDAAVRDLHVMGYSVPVRARLSLSELRPHLHTLPEHPDWIPYRTSYYAEQWGFCLSERRLAELREDELYDVVIDATLGPGHLSYGECVLPGTSDAEVLVSAHVCHPSLANDNLSGIVSAVRLAEALQVRERRHTFRFVFAPGTIGAITWLARNRDVVPRIRHGLVLTGVGDRGGLTYKRTRHGRADVDRAMALVLAEAGVPYALQDFSPWGYDERQYGSPGFDLPVGCLMRTPHGTYPEYHTSADDLSFVAPESLAETVERCLALVEVLERDRRWINRQPYGEPQLGRRGLYAATGGATDPKAAQLAMLWVLNLSDGEHSLVDVAERSGLPFATVADAADALAAHDLLAPAD